MRKDLREYFLTEKFVQMIEQKFAQIFFESQIFVQIFAQIKAKNNHAANVFTIFCANFCTLQIFSQKFAQKRRKFSLDSIFKIGTNKCFKGKEWHLQELNWFWNHVNQVYLKQIITSA